MPLLLLLAFIGVPMLEIAVFIQVGGMIGLWATLGLVLLTAFVGTWQLRAQGLATLARGRAQLDAGELPTRELFDGMCLVLAGALLLTPGFVTDFFGLLLFLPPFRDWLRGFFSRQMATRGQTRVWVGGEEVHPGARPGARPGPAPRRRPGADGIIDADYEDVTPPDEETGTRPDRLDGGDAPSDGARSREGRDRGRPS